MSRDIVKIGGQAIATTSTGATSWREAVATFVAHQDVKESSRNLYARQMKLFFEWVEETGRLIKDLTQIDLLAYKDYLLLDKKLSPLSVGSYLTSLRKFYEWAEAFKIYPNIAKGVKTPKRKQEFIKQHLTEEKSGELLEHFKETSLRDYAIVSLALRTGLRTVEIVRANIGDIVLRGDKRILKVWGKGHDSADSFVVLTQKAYQPIADYLATRPRAKANEPLFSSDSHRNSGERLTTRTISGLIKSGLKAIGLDSREYTAHSLRHTTAVTILRNGGSLLDAQRVLRHTNPNTTQIYIKSIEEEDRLNAPAEAILDVI